MKRIKEILIERVEERRDVTIGIRCDMCGAECEYPEDGHWSYCGGYAIVKAEYRFLIDGEELYKGVDLCPYCMDVLCKKIESGELKSEKSHEAPPGADRVRWGLYSSHPAASSSEEGQEKGI